MTDPAHEFGDDERQNYRAENEREGRDKPEQKPQRKWLDVGTRGYRVMSLNHAMRAGLVEITPERPYDPYPEESE